VRAVDIVELAWKPMARRLRAHEIVSYTSFGEQFAGAAARFLLEAIEEVPHGAVLVFSAHGVPPTVRDEAKSRALKVIDALAVGDQSAPGSA